MPVLTHKWRDEALAMFQAGAVLNCWRRSTPHNWWLETEDGDELHLSEIQELQGFQHTLLACATPVVEESPRIAPSRLHRDGGKPEWSKWVYAPSLAAMTEAGTIADIKAALPAPWSGVEVTR